MEYYNERNGLLNKCLQIDLEKLKDYFRQTYLYFENRGYFEFAIKGAWEKPAHQKAYLVEPPTFIPSAEVYFANKLQNAEVWPVHMNFENYDETTLFTVIEILYDHIAVYDWDKERVVKDYPREEFSEQINNLLKAYKDGYYLEPTSGYIMRIPNQALQEQLKERTDDMPDDVIDKLSAATRMYYRFDSSMEEKKKAINILADILENVRDDVKDIFDKEHLRKKPHDSLIFNIVNGFNIRHNKKGQKTEYSKDIWYDWMMQYYTSVIIAYYKIKKDREYDDLF